ncbi:MAG: non-heme iron oxygenase ferredoxin subunit [Pyrinomonadaceae bacterium]|nr:non-heme iron oxygenase ferredoxin subunit [Pyrinomonadaceae bacterium]
MKSRDADTPNSKRPKRQNRLISVCRVEDLPPGRGATVELAGGEEIAIFNVNGEFFAIENFCPHRGAPLADGDICGHEVECSRHGWRFSLRTGACLSHTGSNIEAYEVIIKDGELKVKI